VSIETDIGKQKRYDRLVRARQEYDPTALGLVNPSRVDGGTYDAPHMGPWTRWAHDLNADLMVIGQDWGDEAYFRANDGLDKLTNPTNKTLRVLLDGVGRQIPAPPQRDADTSDEESRAMCGIYLTNALLWLKSGGLSAPVSDSWFGDAAVPFLKEQIEIVRPRVIVALGQRAYDCVLRAYGLRPHKGPFRLAVEDRNGVALPLDGQSTRLLAVYHCGTRIRNTLREMDEQMRDWQRVADALSA